jgi:dTDP-glucose pyrophosphorylase
VNKPTLVVLAAGIGSRYGGLKQIEPVGPHGATIIDYSIFDGLRAGFGEIVFVMRKDIEVAFRQTIGARFEKRAAVKYVFQELDKLPAGFSVPAHRSKPWGTAHAIWMATECVSAPFAVVNGDDFYGKTSFELLCGHLASSSPDFAMVGFLLRNTLSEHGNVSRGVCRVGSDGLLESVTELTRISKDGAQAIHTEESGRVRTLTGDEVVSMNMWGFTPAIFPQIEKQMALFLAERPNDPKAEFYIPTVVNALVKQGQAQVKVLRTPDSWLGVTYQEDRPQVMDGIRRLVESKEYPERLWH